MSTTSSKEGLPGAHSRTQYVYPTQRTSRAPSGILSIVASTHSYIDVKPPLSASSPELYLQTEAFTCSGDNPSVGNAFIERKYNGKIVRDVCLDTHDLLNEPGGIIINWFRHGATSDSNELRIHLCIRERRKPSFDVVPPPGTLTVTDDYAREIFRVIRTTPTMKTLSAVLEINDKLDLYELKRCPEQVSPEFLRQFVYPIPITLTKFQVEIPGMSESYLPEWRFLLEQQTSLKTLICNFGVVMWNFYQKAITRNQKTLDRVILRRLQTYEISKGLYTPMDWKMFYKCARLTFLKVTCGYRSIPVEEGYIAAPPTTVFLHINLNSLPKNLKELHLGRIWVEPCLLQEFKGVRPWLSFCANCRDLEYYDADATGKDKHSNKNKTMITISSIDLMAEFPHCRHRSSDDKQLFTIIIALFQVILIALTILFIIIYFGHWKRRYSDHRNETVNASTFDLPPHTLHK